MEHKTEKNASGVSPGRSRLLFQCSQGPLVLGSAHIARLTHGAAIGPRSPTSAPVLMAFRNADRRQELTRNQGFVGLPETHSLVFHGGPAFIPERRRKQGDRGDRDPER